MEEEKKIKFNNDIETTSKEIILIIQGKEIKVDGRFRKLSEMINSILEINPSEAIPLDENVVT